MPRSPAEQHMEDAARAYFANVTKGDVEGILALFADDAQLINPMTGPGGHSGQGGPAVFLSAAGVEPGGLPRRPDRYRD